MTYERKSELVGGFLFLAALVASTAFFYWLLPFDYVPRPAEPEPPCVGTYYTRVRFGVDKNLGTDDLDRARVLGGDYPIYRVCR